MPKSATPQRIIRTLERKDFVLKRVKGSHYIFRHKVTNQRIIVPLHKKDLPKGTLHSIIKSAGLEEEDF
jgi:predicted RNA binding protein YcfA (HicA-like mRNA interferase family)